MGFDRLILLERISRQKSITQKTAHTNFTNDVLINTKIKNGKWNQLYTDGMKMDELKDLITDT